MRLGVKVFVSVLSITMEFSRSAADCYTLVVSTPDSPSHLSLQGIQLCRKLYCQVFFSWLHLKKQDICPNQNGQKDKQTEVQCGRLKLLS